MNDQLGSLLALVLFDLRRSCLKNFKGLNWSFLMITKRFIRSIRVSGITVVLTNADGLQTTPHVGRL